MLSKFVVEEPQRLSSSPSRSPGVSSGGGDTLPSLKSLGLLSVNKDHPCAPPPPPFIGPVLNRNLIFRDSERVYFAGSKTLDLCPPPRQLLLFTPYHHPLSPSSLTMRISTSSVAYRPGPRRTETKLHRVKPYCRPTSGSTSSISNIMHSRPSASASFRHYIDFSAPVDSILGPLALVDKSVHIHLDGQGNHEDHQLSTLDARTRQTWRQEEVDALGRAIDHFRYSWPRLDPCTSLSDDQKLIWTEIYRLYCLDWNAKYPGVRHRGADGMLRVATNRFGRRPKGTQIRPPVFNNEDNALRKEQLEQLKAHLQDQLG
ncbi:hypothetical protein FRB94_008899 [Tulasnella sp. JGI-2019a]|nr:hypothetical protein FRB93_003006 [Tulasnella sp. JGI-2019a]KAG8995643.1 hypothetical protein FRB94_008899 [Tulasnella sp. JGI-2019a]KAG9026625.1 hypothetical protein FRB95_008652 [Tulasnella sp. JGI-2019a]